MRKLASNMQRNEREARSIVQHELSASLLLAGGTQFDVQLLDLSYNGCKVGDVSIVLDRQTPIAVRLPGLSEYTVGRVAWCDKRNIGIEFEAPLFEPVFRYLHDKFFDLEKVD